MLVTGTFMMSPSVLYWERKWIRLHAVVVSKPSKATQTLIKSMAHYLPDLAETIV